MSLEKKYKWAVDFLRKYYPDFKDAETLYDEIIGYSLGANFLLLDAGCGKGETIAKYKEKVKLAAGIDVDQESLKKSVVRQNLLVGSLENIPFKDETFDVILCRWVAEHLKYPQKTFKEFHRILKSNGKLFILTSNVYNYAMLINKILPVKIKNKILSYLGRSESDTFPTYYRCNSPTKLKVVAEISGLKVTEFLLIGNPFYLFFSKLLFRFGIIYEKLTDISLLKKGKIHIIAVFKKP